MATTPPIIASLSPVGNPAQQIVRPEKMSLGSGVKLRGGACLFFMSDDVIHPGVRTGSIRSHARLYCGKSEVADIIWVT
jgi:hypothetical protein